MEFHQSCSHAMQSFIFHKPRQREEAQQLRIDCCVSSHKAGGSARHVGMEMSQIP